MRSGVQGGSGRLPTARGGLRQGPSWIALQPSGGDDDAVKHGSHEEPSGTRERHLLRAAPAAALLALGGGLLLALRARASRLDELLSTKLDLHAEVLDTGIVVLIVALEAFLEARLLVGRPAGKTGA